MLQASRPLTLDGRREYANNFIAIILSLLSFQYFSFHDATTDTPVEYTDNADCVNPGGSLNVGDLVTLEPGEDSIIEGIIEAFDPLLAKLKPRHMYKISLTPQDV